jgi:hypothetical protein
LASGVHLGFAARGIDNMQTSGEMQNLAVHIRELETENFETLILEIWRRFTERHIEMERNRSGYEIDGWTSP